jgi:hypothetical protein
MSHQVKFVLWFVDDQTMKWVVIRSCDLNELLSMRRELLECGVECTTIKKERLA